MTKHTSMPVLERDGLGNDTAGLRKERPADVGTRKARRDPPQRKQAVEHAAADYRVILACRYTSTREPEKH